jgi:hypothetical protein
MRVVKGRRVDLRSTGPGAALVGGALISSFVALFTVVVSGFGSSAGHARPSESARPRATASPPPSPAQSPPVPSPASAATPATPPGYAPDKAVIHSSFADPTVIKVGATYYAYGTNDAGATMPVATAPSPAGPWARQDTDGLVRLPSWATPGWTWAPEVVPPRAGNGQFLLYFSARRKDREMQCIGVAASSSPTGPFVSLDGDPLICPANLGGAIDPASFIEQDGTRYLLYKTDARKTAAIYLVKLSPDGLYTAGPPKKLLSRSGNEPVLVESPDLVRRGGKYVLLYSAGWYFTSDYQTRYATAASLEGPYVKAGTLQTTGGYQGKVKGPGGADIVSDEAGDHLAFHGILKFEGGSKVTRGLFVAPLGWAGAKPVLQGVTTRYEAERWRLNGCTAPTGRKHASGGRALNPVPANGCRVEADVFVPVAGRYGIKVGFANRSGQDSHQELTVNGAAPTQIKLGKTGGDDWTSTSAEADLKAGWNVLGLRSLDGRGQLDYLEVR